ncbi:endo-1,4-beta-xylanase [Echinicola vietnamensis]|uniref:endo-1,4-beta-xylanase n=1 Tax=Echinicola vietnamensis (strain DSM 17526 / LMG 23754 / KMM 6221) TaxID=926556 RepID=L0G017_ECHVK|nr:endo-1,4-beta-xylanase [Echinicola vietnamensis]AGA78902.1 beta-1,4-xylanase [Echinicola vietnamensis DSM 17526]
MKTRYINILGILALGLGTSCVDYVPTDEYQVEKPESIALQEELNAYLPLKSYVDSIAHPDFILGGAVSQSEYADKGVMYRLINSNFNEITAGYGMKHGAVVQADGSLLLDGVNAMYEAAAAAGTSIYGHTLCWHANQNAGYLNGLLEPLVVNSPAFANELDLSPALEGDLSGWDTQGEVAIAQNEGMGTGTPAFKLSAGESVSEPSNLQLVTPEMTIVPGNEYEIVAYVKSDIPAEGRISFEGLENNEPEMDWMSTGEISATFQTSMSWKEIRIRVNDFQGETFKIKFDLGYTPGATTYLDINNLYVFDPNGEPMINNLVVDGDFEAGTGWGGWGNGSTRGITEDGMGFGGEGKAFFVTNPSVTGGFWEVQTSYEFAEPLENGEAYKLSFWVKGDAEGIIRPELQSPDYSSNGYGQVMVTKEWQQVELTTTATADDRSRLIFSYGEFAGTVYIDNVVLSSASFSGGSTTLVQKTPEEKEAIISGELERWIAEMVTNSKAHVKAWDVVNEPMDDGNPHELKTGIGKTDMASDEFYWQDYVGKDYAVKAFQWAREYGNPDDLHFINDYNLEYNLDKCQGIIDYVAYLESQGAQVDGIGTQMHIGIDSNKQNIAKMFEMLAATGKLIKVSELDVRVNSSTPTAEILQQQSEMYKYVVDMYLQYVPESQRYGITVWGITDSPDDANWLPGEHQGLWDLDLNRKPAYVGFVEGIQGL